MRQASSTDAEERQPSDDGTPAWEIATVRTIGCVLVGGPIAFFALTLLADLRKGSCRASMREGIRARIVEIVAALDVYAAYHDGTYPSSLDALVTKDDVAPWTLSTSHVPRDPWKNDYRYEPPGGDENTLRVWSVGKDGVSGTSDDVDSGELDR